jgi:hypothetical protein
MTIIDRQNLDKIIGEQVKRSLTAEDAVQIGRITNTQLVLTGELLKTKSGYSLQLAVTDVEKAERKASYTVNASAEAIEKSTAVKDAAAELLTQLGIRLTEEGKKKLYGVGANTVDAETALSKGITAQKGGTIVEALSYFYNAASFDSSLAEASGRLNVLSSSIAGGSIGQSVRNDIENRKAWLKAMNDCAAFFRTNLPYEIKYYKNLTQGKVDYQKETVDLSFDVQLRPGSVFQVVNTVREGIENTGKKDEWGFANWPFGGEAKVFDSGAFTCYTHI